MPGSRDDAEMIAASASWMSNVPAERPPNAAQCALRAQNKTSARSAPHWLSRTAPTMLERMGTLAIRKELDQGSKGFLKPRLNCHGGGTGEADGMCIVVCH